MDPESLEVLYECRRLAGDPDMQGIGLHCDGVPHSWDRDESCEVFSVSFPGITGKWQDLRIPLFALPHSAFGPHTWDDIMDIVAWQLRYLWRGVHPEEQPDGAELTERARRQKAGTPLGVRSCAVEMRGDWKMFADALHLPRWNEKGGICWSCTCRVSQVRASALYRIRPSSESCTV